MFALLGFFLMHFGFGLSLYLGNFPWISAFTMLGLLPSAFWDKLIAIFRTEERLGLRIYYDQDCGFCTKAARIIRTFFLLPETRILPAQTGPSIESDMNRNNSWVIVDNNGERHFGYKAFVLIARLSPVLWPLAPLLRLSWVGEVGGKIYTTVAKHRRKTCALDNRESVVAGYPVRSSAIANVLATCLICYVGYWNLGNLPWTRLQLPEPFTSVAYLLRLDQKWSLFAPYPMKHDGWFVIPGTLRNGELVDLFSGMYGVDWTKPSYASKTYKNFRWRKYMMALWEKEYQRDRLYYAQYLCREWNSRHSGDYKLEELAVFYVLETTLPDYRPPRPQKTLYVKHKCTDDTAGVRREIVDGDFPDNTSNSLLPSSSLP
jgi:hypothetical protein